MLGRWRRRGRLRKVKSGDGSALPRYRWWDFLWRTRFFVEIDEQEYAVDVDYFGDEKAVKLYVDRAQVAYSSPPAAIAVPNGVIEVGLSTFGLTRMHLVTPEGEERPLRPHRRSMEGLRARFGRRFPRLSRGIGAAAIAVLLLSLALGGPQIVQWISEFPVVAENVGTFTSPIVLPAELNSVLFVAGLVASMERAITLRSHWLIDFETWWLGS